MKTKFDLKMNIIKTLISVFNGHIVRVAEINNDLNEAEVIVNNTRLLFTSKGWCNTIPVGLTKSKLVEMGTAFCSKLNLIYAQDDEIRIRYDTDLEYDFNNFIDYRKCPKDLISRDGVYRKIDDFKNLIADRHNFEFQYTVNKKSKSKSKYVLNFSVIKFNFNIINEVSSTSLVNKIKDIEHLDKFKSSLSDDFKLLKFKNEFLDEVKDLTNISEINQAHTAFMIKELNYIKSEVITRYTDKVIRELNSEFSYK